MISWAARGDTMLSFEEARWDLEEAVRCFWKHLSHGSVPQQAKIEYEDAVREFWKHLARCSVPEQISMPPDVPPIVQRLWGQCEAILKELNSPEFEEISW